MHETTYSAVATNRPMRRKAVSSALLLLLGGLPLMTTGCADSMMNSDANEARAERAGNKIDSRIDAETDEALDNTLNEIFD